MKEVQAFLRTDHEGHLAHSADELIRHADWADGLSAEEREQYFYGITTVFPLMLLGHYHEWLTDADLSAYMERFVPDMEAKLAPQTEAVLHAIYAAPESGEVWIAAVSSYLATVPYDVLRAFSAWAGLGDQESVGDE
ncbi:MAG: hypothetical protein IJ751_02845 [Oscillospiraceae bacterium]|nr:hypothetical protein [Oscillospiraceae bacterium]